MHAWGKVDNKTGLQHHLAHHSADVAATLTALLNIPSFQARAEQAAECDLTIEKISCLGALAFLHDIGKLAPGFQVKALALADALADPLIPTPRDHIKCGWKWYSQDRKPENALAGHAVHIAKWPNIKDWFSVLFAHHGRPVPHPNEDWGQDAFRSIPHYDWEAEECQMGEALISWFPDIRENMPPPLNPAFAHLFAGLLALADWIGSDRNAFPFLADFDLGYWPKACEQARKQLKEIGLDTRLRAMAGPADWVLLSEHPTPRPAQKIVSDISLSEQLVILEAETGSGKTEAALWRFTRLYEAGVVDSLYFAVPTRAAARQLQNRVNEALKRIFVPPAPEAVLAIPGQALAGEARGTRLPGFQMRWDDTEEHCASRWAAEHETRFLAAQIAVGTVDQVMLAGLKAKHAHLRGSALSRSLLVIDEVHASDAWMTEIQRNILDDHRALGGHAFLMSATLGSSARVAWRGESLPPLANAEAEIYPAVWTLDTKVPVPQNSTAQKEVLICAHPGWSGEDASHAAIKAAQEGARVLVIRNTVDRARETHASCCKQAANLVFNLDRISTLHHNRFAAEDRARLDARVEELFGKCSSAQGVVLIGTQTLEQSLDIDADFLVTDLCPIDVLLQRIGRLHRHERIRPADFQRAATLVLCPPGELSLLTKKPANGLGAYGKNASLSGVYMDVSGISATLSEIKSEPLWRIPEMNRKLVERATHPERLEEIAKKNGWEDYHRRVTGKALAQTHGAKLVTLDRKKPFPDSFPDDKAIRTRLGTDGIILALPEGTMGPFGHCVKTISLPQHWSRGLTGKEKVVIEAGTPLVFKIGDRRFCYDATGLQRMEEGHV